MFEARKNCLKLDDYITIYMRALAISLKSFCYQRKLVFEATHSNIYSVGLPFFRISLALIQTKVGEKKKLSLFMTAVWPLKTKWSKTRKKAFIIDCKWFF